MVHMSVLALVDTLGVRTWENNFFSLCENDHYKGPLCVRELRAPKPTMCVVLTVLHSRLRARIPSSANKVLEMPWME